MRSLLLLLMLSLLVVPVAAGEPEGKQPPLIPARVELDPAGKVEALLGELDLNVDAVFHDWARVYIVEEQREKLAWYGVMATDLPDNGPQMAALAQIAAQEPPVSTPEGSVPAQYHTYTTLTADLQQIATDHPAISRLISVGQSTQGRELWMMKLTANPDVDESEPEFLYISSMHGDEVTGKELLFNLIDYITDNYGSDPRITNLIDTTEIWIMPSMNPDGTELGQRGNANNVDLNRNFPDQYDDPINDSSGRQAETVAIMNWRLSHYPALSANMHGGALVANYPFDSNPGGSSTFTPTPDDSTFVSVARTYADNNPPMSTSNGHPAFDDGITNGADWYAINGGMQDWEYVWYGDLDLTLEVSNTKWPAAADLPGFWDDNLESMLSYMERVHDGIHGVVTDADSGLPLAATIEIAGAPYPTYSDPDVGDYHRVVVPGTYDLIVSAPSHETKTIPGVVVPAGGSTVMDIQLGAQPVALQPMSFVVDDGGDGNLVGGESASVALTLQNMGRSATNVTANLIPLGEYGSAVQPDADYPDIPLGDNQESIAPHHTIALDPTTPGGHWAGYAVEWFSDQGSGMSDAIFLDVGIPEIMNAASVDVPYSIAAFPLPVTVTSSLPFTGTTSISELRVSLDISHSYIGDLVITLISPAGTRVKLHDRNGGTTDDIVGTYGVDLTPTQSLAAFTGQNSTGLWRLEIVDNALGGSGTLNGWSLEVQGRPLEPSPPQMIFRTFESRPSGTFIEWWPYPDLVSYRVYRSTDPSQAASFIDVTTEDGDITDTQFNDSSTAPISYFLVTGVSANGEGPKGHFGE